MTEAGSATRVHRGPLTPTRVLRRAAASRDLVTIVSLVAIVLAGAALRFTGVGWGDAFVYHPDEGVIVKAAFHMVAAQDWNPHNFLYPSLLTDVVAGLAGIGHAITGLPVATGQEGLFTTEFLPGQFGVFLAGRLLVATLGVATVVAVFAVARRLGGRGEGLLAAAIVAVAPIHIESSRYVTTDVPVTLLCTLALAASIRAVDTPGHKRWWVVAAVCVGLATSTKWNGIAVAIVPAVLYLASAGRSGWAAAVFRSSTPVVMVIAAALALVATTPAVAFAPGEVVSWLGQQAGAYTSVAYAAVRGSGTQNSLAVAAQSVVAGFGLPVVGLALVAVAGLLVVRRRVEFAMALFVLAYVVILSIPILHYPRNALPALPFVAIAIGLLPRRLAALAATRRRGAEDLLRRTRRSRQLRIVLSAVIALAIVPALVQDVADARRLRKPDTRSVAYAWILANLPHNAVIAREQYTPQFLPDQFRLRNHDGLYQRSLAWYREQKVQYLIVSSYIYGRYVDNPARPFDSAFYASVFALPEVFHIDATDSRPGPTIRVFRLGVAPVTAPAH